MAQKTVVTITDDIDGSENASEVQFGYKGTDYTIDLGKENAGAFDEVMESWIAHARRATAGGAGKRRSRARRDTSDVRAWAREQGHKISERGRIPADIQAEYDAAH